MSILESSLLDVSENVHWINNKKEHADFGDQPAPKNSINFRNKEFRSQESILTLLADNSGISTIYNIFIAIFALLLVNTIIENFLENGCLDLNFWIIWWNFGNFPSVMLVWFLMFTSTCFFAYPLFRLWAHFPTEKVTFTSEWPWICLYFGYIISLFWFPLRFLFAYQLPVASSFIITCENVRIVMKLHAFIRENVPHAIDYKISNAKLAIDGQACTDYFNFPSINQFIYYFFCPTFIYRNEYPRSIDCDWMVVLKYFFQCIGSIVFTAFLITHISIPMFKNIDYHTISYSQMILLVFRTIFPGAICLLLLFWGLLHCWMNMFAEFMRFGDRLFYLDWWNCKSMAGYYRNWNLIVHEWLYAYVYKDVAQLIGGKLGRQMGQLIVFFLSALVHEYWFGVAFRMFYPVVFFLYFFLGVPFFFVSRLIKMDQAGNVIMWFNLMLGNGIFLALYSMEWYAKQRCSPSFQNKLLDVVVPRSWICNKT